MSNNFFYTMRTPTSGNQTAAIYSFQEGSYDAGNWRKTIPTLVEIRSIMSGADGARSLTVCTDLIGASRILENRKHRQVSLEIHDQDKFTSGYGAKVVAFVNIDDVVTTKRSPVGPNVLGMSLEKPSTTLFAVTIDFHGSPAGPIFQLTNL